MVFADLGVPVLEKQRDDFGVFLQEFDDMRVLGRLHDMNSLGCRLHFHVDLGCVSKQFSKQGVTHMNGPLLVDTIIHRGHMFLDLRRDLGRIGLCHGLNSVGQIFHLPLDVGAVLQKKMKNLMVLGEGRVLAPSSATGATGSITVSTDGTTRLAQNLVVGPGLTDHVIDITDVYRVRFDMTSSATPPAYPAVALPKVLCR